MYEAMAKAGRAMLALRKRNLSISEKGPLDIVTEADVVAERMLMEWAAVNFPDDGIIAEEGSARSSRSGKWWHFDPIDGTKSFASGLPFFGISAGRDGGDGVPDMGGLYLPAHDEFIFGARGNGVWTIGAGGKKVELFARKPYSRSFRDSIIALALVPPYRDRWGAFLDRCWNGITLGSCVYECFKLVLQGSASAYIHTSATTFDVAGVWAVAHEAGFAVTPIDVRKEKIFFVVAQNEEILDEVVAICPPPRMRA